MKVRLGMMPQIQIPKEVSVTEGIETAAFEKRLADYMGTKYAVATSSGTMAIYGMFQALAKEKRQTVLTSPLTYAATVNVPMLLGWKVEFCDVDPDTYGMDMSLAREVECDVLFPVHLLGYPVEVGKYGGVVVTDACEAVGSDLSRNLGVMSAVSFYPSHTVPVGEMGAVLTSSRGYESMIRMLKNNGRDVTAANAFSHLFVGLNYKSNDLAAYVALKQLAMAPLFMERRRQIAKRYSDEMKMVGGPYSKKCGYLGWPLLCRSNSRREALVDWLLKNEIECRRMFPLITDQPAFSGQWPRRSFPIAEEISGKGLYVPCHQYMTEEQVDWVIRVVNRREFS